MLLNLHKKKWTDGLTLASFGEQEKSTEKAVQVSSRVCVYELMLCYFCFERVSYVCDMKMCEDSTRRTGPTSSLWRAGKVHREARACECVLQYI